MDLVVEIGRRAMGADAVFVYFSGHGMQGPEGNYLIPVDARISEGDHVRREGVNAHDIVTVLRAANPRVALLVLDACRDSPYSRRTRSVAKGLSRMNVSGNLLVAYATVEGSTADDGNVGNSPYALALAQHLKDGTLSVLAQFDAVRRTTLQLTGGRQSPTREGDLEVSVYLSGPTGPVRPEDGRPTPPPNGEAPPISANKDWLTQTRKRLGPVVAALLVACEAGYLKARKTGQPAALYEDCLEQPSPPGHTSTWELRGAAERVKFSLVDLSIQQSDLASGRVKRTDTYLAGDETRQVNVTFKLTPNGWRVSSGNLFTR